MIFNADVKTRAMSIKQELSFEQRGAVNEVCKTSKSQMTRLVGVQKKANLSRADAAAAVLAWQLYLI